jgi:GT2 family glycosyltransferase
MGRNRCPYDWARNLPITRQRSLTPFPLLGPSGCCPIFRMELIKKVQRNGMFFDEQFGSYYEDVDLCWRARLRGFTNGYIPGALAWHQREGSERSPRLQRKLRTQAFRNRLLCLYLNENLFLWLKDLPFWIGYELQNLVKVVWQPYLINAAISLMYKNAYWRLQRKISRSGCTVSPREEQLLFGPPFAYHFHRVIEKWSKR